MKKSPKHHIILTARAGRGKHEWTINNRPLITYPMEAMQNVEAYSKTVWTDCPTVMKYAEDYDLVVKERPEHTTGDNSPHVDIIQYAVAAVASDEDICTVLLGNTVYVDADLIESGYNELVTDKDATGILSCWEAADDHPYRALTLCEDGYLHSYLTIEQKGDATSNRQSHPPIFFYDQGVWTFRARYAKEGGGPHPWVWCGPRTKPIVRPWITGRDVHDGLDLSFSKHWLSSRP